MRRLLILVAGGSLWVTCKSSPIPAGGKCDDSEQCGAGLLCDTTQTPHICTTKLAHVPDLAGTDGAGGPDLASSDLAVDEEQDLSATAHDMAKPVDLAKREDL